MNQKPIKQMSYLNEEGYKNVPVPADVREELREQAVQQKERLYNVIAKMVREMIEEQWHPNYHHGTVYVATKLEDHEMVAMEKLAQKCNMSLAGYVRAYINHKKQDA